MPQVKLTINQVRPNTDVEFYESSFAEEINVYITETYKDTGKLITQQVTFSDDRLTRTGIKIFDSQESRDQLFRDPAFAKDSQARILHNRKNGIVVTVTEEVLP